LRAATASAGLALVLLAGVAAPDVAGAPIPRIGLLAATVCDGHRNYEAFRQGLRDLGYVEGQSVAIECRRGPGRERLTDVAKELVRLKPDVLVTDGSASTRAAMRATKTIPIVMGTVGDPLGSGFVTSLARPEGNVTGLTLVTAELNAKRLELIRELVPGNPRLGVLANPDGAGRTHVRDLEAAAKPFNLTLRVVEARDVEGIERAFVTLARERIGALLALPDALLFNEHRRIVGLAARARLPAVYESREFVEAGGLLAYGPRIRDNFYRAATFVDKILKGAKPADLPIEQPTTFELVVNLQTAAALGLTVPQSILLRADEVIR
jgi:putative ABC transport system substrate-binding protein